MYEVTLADQIYQNFSDNGNDILGPSDSILGGCDTYTWGNPPTWPAPSPTTANSATPYYIAAYSTDQITLQQNGADTLTTNGHVYSTDTFTYGEQTGDNNTVSQAFTGSGFSSTHMGSATDTYSNSDSGVITVSDTVTTSVDNFVVEDTHSISGFLVNTANYGTGSATWTDTGTDVAMMSAAGVYNTGGDSYSFTDSESSNDLFTLNKVIPGSMSGQATISATMQTSESGSTNGTTYAYISSTQTFTSVNESGEVTAGGGTTAFALITTMSLSLRTAISGPPEVGGLIGSYSATSVSGTNDGADLTETEFAGQGDAAGTQVADQIGSSPMGSAEHLGTSPNSLDSSSGLLGGLGGEGVHAMSFVGSEILATASPTGSSLWLEESNQPGQDATDWISHPSGIGYRRSRRGSPLPSGSHSSGSSSPPIPGNWPTMDSGTSDGGASQELARLSNFVSGPATRTHGDPAGRHAAGSSRDFDFPVANPIAVAISNPRAMMPAKTPTMVGVGGLAVQPAVLSAERQVKQSRWTKPGQHEQTGLRHRWVWVPNAQALPMPAARPTRPRASGPCRLPHQRSRPGGQTRECPRARGPRDHHGRFTGNRKRPKRRRGRCSDQGFQGRSQACQFYCLTGPSR